MLPRRAGRAHVLSSGLVIAWAVLALSCEGSPAAPERHGFPLITIVCEPILASMTACRASVSCSLYPCAAGTPSDVTTVATWSSDNTAVIRVAGPGQLESVAPGDTVIRADWSGASGMFRPLSVFPGTAPLPTYAIEGSILEASTTARTPIDGATVEILNGVVAGRTMISGQRPAPRPGYLDISSPGQYRFTGVPNGSFRLRVTKDGYLPQERDVAGVQFTGADFRLVRQ